MGLDAKGDGCKRTIEELCHEILGRLDRGAFVAALVTWLMKLRYGSVVRVLIGGGTVVRRVFAALGGWRADQEDERKSISAASVAH